MAYTIELIVELLSKKRLYLTIEKTPKWVYVVKDEFGIVIARVRNKQSLYRHIRNL